ncbi:UNVERIFIED_CONTAM: 2-oxoglutarate-dependent dioxygenase 21, chloroplastic [Sesamum latifolium]|uniref:2-oxoglutarate-dependent dioxygenase 21, chloroplastic n=1 Tax=Sesamum latifolium TaxID=2727402 RepID=A0AAW2YDZ7_9LAMI
MEENSADVPIIDVSDLLHQKQNDGVSKSMVVERIHEACRTYGFFHVINHGVGETVIEEALDVNTQFFHLPMQIKEEFWSDDVEKVVRFGEVGGGGYSRDFLKLYANPLHQFLPSWPTLPLLYSLSYILQGKMGLYATEVRKLTIQLFGAIMESLHLSETHLKQNFEQGIQILGVNSFSPCSRSDITTGVLPHTDHTFITLLLQSGPGLQIMDRGGSWKSVPRLKGSLQVLVGDHLEVLSNGLYKSVLHRVPSCKDTRLSIANLHSLGMDEIVEPAGELGNEGRYRGSSLRDFLKHLASRDTRPFIETLRIN